jgi:hypothetical protein
MQFQVQGRPSQLEVQLISSMHILYGISDLNNEGLTEE